MELTPAAKTYCAENFPGGKAPFADTDPEFAALFANFAFDEVPQDSALDGQTRFLAIMACLLGCQGLAAFRALMPAALRGGVTPVQLKETVYQATAYLGLGRALPFLQAVNEGLAQQGVALPLPGQATTTRADRREKGTQVQVTLFGEHMQDFWRSGPPETRRVNRWLAANCFGDYYTRGGLDLRQRELVTFCFLAAQGGCEPQLVSHAAANLRLGRDAAFLADVVAQCLPYVGYPRSLNALRCVQQAAGQQEKEGSI